MVLFVVITTACDTQQVAVGILAMVSCVLLSRCLLLLSLNRRPLLVELLLTRPNPSLHLSGGLASLAERRSHEWLVVRLFLLVSLVCSQDEELFGPPARLKQMSGNRSWNESRGGVDWSFGSSSTNTAGENYRS